MPRLFYNHFMPDYLLESKCLPWPADWTTIFGREAPLYLEIGFGNGQFLRDLAARHPAGNIVGLEISLPAQRRAARRLQRAGLANVRLLNAVALFGVWVFFAPGSPAGVFINFPDPWPKPAHHHRRLINPRFLDLLADRLPAGAPLEIATDHAGYAAQIEACLLATPYFHSRLPAPFVTEDPQRIRTKYEQIALAAGRTCHYFKWQRNSRPAGTPFPIPPEYPMPHIVMYSPLPLAEVAAQFVPLAWSSAAASGRFVDVYASHRAEVLLVDTYVSEEPMTQRIALTIGQRPDNELILGLHELGFPRPTAGVHHALSALAGWLQTLHPAMVIRHSNLQVNHAA